MRRAVLLIVDLSVLALATVAALLLRDNLEFSLPRLIDLLPYLGFSVAAGAVVFTVGGFNRSIWRFSGLPDYLSVGVGVLVTVFLSVCLSFVFNRLEGVARSLPLIQAILAIAVMVGIRVLMRMRREARARPREVELGVRESGEAVLLIGLNTITEFYLRCVAEFGGDNFRIAGILGRSRRHSGRMVFQHPILGVPEDLIAVLQDLGVHGVHVTRVLVVQREEDLSAEALGLLLQARKDFGIRIEMLADKLGFDAAPGPEDAAVANSALDDQQASDALAFAAIRAEAALARPYWLGKRIADGTLAVTSLVVLSPLIAIVGLLAVIDVGLPAIFWQERLGRYGKPFRLYKILTMAEAFDEAGERLLDAPRTSAIGNLLRRTRFDELPQLYNVLLGEMSIVGPRPLLRVDQPSPFSARLLVRPGLTGWAQVNGGRLLSAKDKEAMDMWYVCHASAKLDLIVAWRTIALLVWGERLDPAAIDTIWQELSEMAREDGGPRRPSAPHAA